MQPLDRSELPPDSPFRRITDWPGLLAEIRKRPAMWFGQPSVTALGDFVHGMCWAEFLHDVPMEKRLASFPSEEFESWVVLHFTPEGRTPYRSFGLALDLAGSEEAGFNLWLDWYDRFMQALAEGMIGNSGGGCGWLANHGADDGATREHPPAGGVSRRERSD